MVFRRTAAFLIAATAAAAAAMAVFYEVTEALLDAGVDAVDVDGFFPG